jgi:RHS repeat-associated protein
VLALIYPGRALEGGFECNRDLSTAKNPTDEAGKSRKSCTDGLGRLSVEWEDPSALNYETDYGYDTLGNLLSVTQKGSSPTNSANWRTRSFTYDSLSRLLSAANPESGSVSYAYDSDGNVFTKTAPKPNQASPSVTVVTTSTYDSLNRLKKKAYNDGSTATAQFGYDGVALTGCTTAPSTLADSYPVGRRTAMCDASGATSWNHDQMGRALSEKRTINAQTQTTSYAYNLDGSLSTLTYPGTGEIVTYTPGGAGRPTAGQDTAGGINYVESATYASSGGLTAMIYGKTAAFAGITIANAYNQRIQPVQLFASSPSGTVFSLCFDFHLGVAISTTHCSFLASSLGDNGNIDQIVNNRDTTRTQIFTYDSLNRITSGESNGTQWGENFTIDAWGNLTNRSLPSGKTSYEALDCPANAANQLTACSLTYDAAGNVISNGPTSTYSYDAENRLITTSGYTYTYDGDGKRVKKATGASGTLYWQGPVGDPIAEANLTGVSLEEYIFFGGTRVARRDVSGTVVHYYFSDHLGSHGVVENATGSSCEQDIDFFPYGGVAHDYCATVTQHYRFTGKERDAESGLDYYGARHLASSLGRFMQPDPKPRSAHAPDPQSWNRYSYTRNNPLEFVDPDGMDLVLAQGMNSKDQAYVVNNLARMYATPGGKAMLERANQSKFTITVGTGHLGRTDLTKATPGTSVIGGQTRVEGGVTRYSDFEADGHKILVAKSPDSPTAPAIQVIVDKDQSAEIGKDPAAVFAHEIGGHTAEVINSAESNPNQFIDGVNPKDETASEQAEKALGTIPKNPTPDDVQAVQELLKPNQSGGQVVRDKSKDED